MLVVTANWSITDASLVDGPSRAQCREFIAEIRRSAVRAGFRRDGGYRPIERVEIVLAGDTFDGLLTAAWLGAERPWQRRAQQGAVRARVMQATLRGGARLLCSLPRRLEVPAADGRARPVMGSQVGIPVRVTLLAGDRDAWLEEEHCLKLADRLGITVGRFWANHAVFIMHGQEFDPLCGPHRLGAVERPPTLHESLTVDLIARFGMNLRGAGVSDALARRLLRPLATAQPLDAPRRLQGWLVRAASAGEMTAAARQQVVLTWRRTVDEWHQRARREVPETEIQFDAVDAIARWMAEEDEAAGGLAMPTAVPDVPWLLPANVDLPTAAVFGHVPAGSGGFGIGPRTRTICLGPRAGRRSTGYGPLERGSAVDVAMIKPSIETFAQRPPVVTFFEADEAGGLDLVVGDAVTEEVAETPGPTASIVDAA